MERDLSRETAERLLGGDLSTPPDGAERLAALLAAASAPGRPDELVGEAAAIAAFRAHPPTVRRWSLRRAVTIKVAAVVAVTVAAGGVAVAGGTGLLNIPFIPDRTGPVPSTDASGRSPGHGHSASPNQSPPDEKTVKDCVDYKKRSEDDKQKELRGNRFENLVRQAGGPEHVDAYCDKVLAASPPPDKGNEGGQGSPGSGAPSGITPGTGLPDFVTPGSTPSSVPGRAHAPSPPAPPASPNAGHERPNPAG